MNLAAGNPVSNQEAPGTFGLVEPCGSCRSGKKQSKNLLNSMHPVSMNWPCYFPCLRTL